MKPGMIRLSLCFISHVVTLGLFAQDTIFYKNWKETTSSRDSCEFYQIVSDKAGDSTIVRTFFQSGERKSEKRCINRETSFEKGVMTTWYKNGQKKSSGDYELAKCAHFGKSYTSYWPDGTLKRKDSFGKNCKSKRGKCFGRDGRDTPYYAIEIMPYFSKWQDSLNAFFRGNLRYPESCLEQNIEGTVYTQFFINEDGTISGIRVSNTEIDPRLQEEALRVIRLMHPWTPGYQDGEPVKVLMRYPIKFTLS